MISKRKVLILLGAALILAGTAQAAAILTHTSGQVKIGVDDFAQLNIPGGVASVTGETLVGVRYLPTPGGAEFEVTSHGCLCEGWGVAYDGSVSGFANNATGIGGLVDVGGGAVSGDGTTVTVVSDATNLRVTHEFRSSTATDKLYEVVVTIEAFAGAATDVTYRRTMDWDTDPTPFNEFVTIGGTAAASAVLSATNNGFCVSDPLVACTELFAGGTGDFTDLGPSDHGANFDFGFGDLGVEESVSFSIYYGGADNVADAFAVMAAQGIEVFSLGRSGTDVDGDGFNDITGALTPTYIFGFKGVGGVPVPPVPEPATVTLLGLGLLAIGLGRKRRA